MKIKELRVKIVDVNYNLRQLLKKGKIKLLEITHDKNLEYVREITSTKVEALTEDMIIKAPIKEVKEEKPEIETEAPNRKSFVYKQRYDMDRLNMNMTIHRMHEDHKDFKPVANPNDPLLQVINRAGAFNKDLRMFDNIRNYEEKEGFTSPMDIHKSLRFLEYFYRTYNNEVKMPTVFASLDKLYLNMFKKLEQSLINQMNLLNDRVLYFKKLKDNHFFNERYIEQSQQELLAIASKITKISAYHNNFVELGDEYTYKYNLFMTNVNALKRDEVVYKKAM